MINRSLSQQLDDLSKGEYSSVELTQTYLDRIENHQSLNAFVSISKDVLEKARQADQLRAAGERKPLLGIPLAHKDIFCEAGVRTTAGSKMLDNFISPYDSTVVSLLRNAGALSLGKTNMDEFAMGSSNESSYFGAVKNPWQVDRVPGGSSGGSAAAVAARLCAAATGTDTGGSIRQPAAFCGITGIKPTYGRVSRWGMIAYASSLDQAGPLATTAEDCALLLSAMAGVDEKDSTSSAVQVEDYSKSLSQDLKGKKIGLCVEYMKGLDPEMSRVIEEAIDVLSKLGAEFMDISLPTSPMAIPAYYIIAPAECSANLSRYDGVRFGYRCENPENLEDLYKRSRSESFGQEVKNRIMVGAFALSAGYYDAYYKKAQQIRRLIKNDFLEAFKSVDAILGPTTPGPAFKIGANADEPQAMYLQDIYTISANLAGLPAISLPAGFIEDLPAGIQLIGNYFDEATLLNLGHQFQAQTDWHKQAPELST
ncbi:MAG: Asp-tRNA(Asn)/Glu-tRNA(Gln) amidotransferase subunit GatA [Gammaproteobacteria bacterium]|jgi:aspartyl-tRNA(Asn)/glutamyl-tRNA(Gln) amidotransferase subunit A|nr:Asp-tRNA(Asn)/Glu-tRNA(Gln) amidotransferase subunit GatA [Gammaproteobacteria bacterium]MBT3870692.1 Asp-tRNA(Asn)/Glu-tRNA(Gln) amidotransferase subunit GatA [Gammaproteobacteria bacterium]MBT4380554.1 Asp-tRNA(Asn)/Glu-tRNA(Gln) amidotransferase subunit GatA [Gammaproteobacteria bacterium]MBT4617427.1 Asp-tRNA(Asn)/Glu-tRNA(Gln) amidotransferase subunit GatA [Gammaproteobacteria bacterium]MBT5196672.1 Asp-tRNA(Asn)/Glu-tRNA(Gln) amidotransferase subunit GatA [Gammaproteobacteria bacterium